MINAIGHLRSWLSKDLTSLTSWALGLFYFSAFVAVNMFSRSSLSVIFTLLRYLSYLFLGLLALYSITGKGSMKQMLQKLLEFFKSNLILDVALVISLLSCYYRRAVEPAVLLLLMLSAKNLGMKQVVRLFFWIGSFWFVFTVLCSVVGILPNLMFIRADAVRWSLGFIYPLEAHSVLFLIGLSGLYLYWDKSRWLPEVLFFGISLLLYQATKARFSMALTIFTCLLFLICANVKSRTMKKMVRSKLMRVLLVLFVLAMFITPAVLAYNFQWGSRLFSAINELVNDRLVLGRRAFAFIPLFPFGYPVQWVGYGGAVGAAGMAQLWETYNYVDCSYLKNMFDYGYVYLLLEFGFYMWILLHSARKGNWPMTLAGICVMLLGLFEARLMQIAVNPFVLAGSGLLFWQPWKKSETLPNSRSA